MITEVVNARQVPQAVVDLVRRRDTHLIVLGAYHEGKYVGAPLGHAIEAIAANAPCDVLIGVQGKHGKILTQPAPATKNASPPITY